MSDPNLRGEDKPSPPATDMKYDAPRSAVPDMASRSAAPEGTERRPPDLEAAKDFRQLNQAERMRDDGMKAGAKMVAAIDAAIDRKYGAATPEANKMKRAARESVAQTLEQGARVAAPRVREADRQRETGIESTRENERQARERDR